MNKFWVVVREIYRKNVKTWAFFWVTFGPVIVGLIIGGVVYYIYQAENNNSVGNIAVISNDQAVTQVIQQVEDRNTYRFDLDEKEAEKALEDKEIEGYLTVAQSDPIAIKFYKKTTGNNIDFTAMKEALDHYQIGKLSQAIGLDQKQLAQINNAKVNFETLNVSTDEKGNIQETSDQDPKMMVRTGVAYVSAILILFFIMNFSNIISQEIANEKGSRIMEIILSSISATTHFYGKMVGIALVLLTQLGLYGLIYLIINFVFYQTDFLDALAIPHFNIGELIAGSETMVLISIGFALLGILSYASLSGFLGSLVQNIQDVNKNLMPIVMVAVAGFYIGMFAMGAPNNPVVRIGSFFPLVSPMIMPFRIASLTVSATEIIISAVISLIFTIFSFVLASMFYKSNVLTTTDKGIVNTMKRSFALWKSERAAH